MPKGPDEKLIKFSEDEAHRLIRLYEKAERDITSEINRCLLKGNQTRYLKSMQENVRVVLADLESGSRKWCKDSIPRIYLQGAKAADTQMTTLGKKVAIGFGAVHQQAAKILADAAYNKFTDSNKMIGRRVDDIYRYLALENVRASTIGYQSWQKVARNYREQLVDQGVTGFKDSRGRKWNMSTYAEMVARTTTMEAHLEGTKTRLLENGHDLVQVSAHSNPCGLCAPWEGRILSLSGQDKDHPSLDDAKAAGLFHPNCRHGYGLYIDLDAEIDQLKKELGEDGEKSRPIKGKESEKSERKPVHPKLEKVIAAIKNLGWEKKLDRKPLAKKVLKELEIGHIPVEIKKTNDRGYCGIIFDSTAEVKYYVLNSSDNRIEPYHVKTLFHEAFHAKVDGLANDYRVASDAWLQVEETLAESAAHYLYGQTKYQHEICPSYPEKLVEVLPRLKQLDKFRDCSKLSDFGKIAWEDRLNGVAAEWEPIYNECMKVGYNWQDLLRKHEKYIADNIDELLDVMLDNMPQYAQYKSDMAGDFNAAAHNIAVGMPLNGNQDMVAKNLLAITMNRKGI